MSAAPGERLFFALWPSDGERERMVAAAARLALGEPARRVVPEEYHLTVAFIGQVAAARIEAVRNIGAATAAARFALRFDAYEYWPKPEVVVAAARSVPPALERLWRDLHARLAADGFALDPKRLRPHVTLARGVRDAPALPAIPECRWDALALCLVRSAHGRGVPAYTVVDRWSLLDETPQP